MTPDQIASFLSTLDGWVRSAVRYEWGQKRYPPIPPHYGMDCSGTVCMALELAGVVPPGFGREHNAQSLWDALGHVEGDAVPGDLCFYAHGGSDHITHVMAVADGGRVVGASGGGSHTISVAIAEAEDARVMYRSRATYRPGDVRGYRRWTGAGV